MMTSENIVSPPLSSWLYQYLLCGDNIDGDKEIRDVPDIRNMTAVTTNMMTTMIYESHRIPSPIIFPTKIMINNTFHHIFHTGFVYVGEAGEAEEWL